MRNNAANEKESGGVGRNRKESEGIGRSGEGYRSRIRRRVRRPSEGHQEATKGPSGGHQEAIRRQSGGHQGAIRGKSEGHQEAIRRPSEGHEEVIRRQLKAIRRRPKGEHLESKEVCRIAKQALLLRRERGQPRADLAPHARRIVAGVPDGRALKVSGRLVEGRGRSGEGPWKGVEGQLKARGRAWKVRGESAAHSGSANQPRLNSIERCAARRSAEASDAGSRQSELSAMEMRPPCANRKRALGSDRERSGAIGSDREAIRRHPEAIRGQQRQCGAMRSKHLPRRKLGAVACHRIRMREEHVVGGHIPGGRPWMGVDGQGRAHGRAWKVRGACGERPRTAP